MSKIKEFIKNISPFNNRTDMPNLLYIIKVIIMFWVFKFGGELVGEALAIGVHFACGKNPLKGEMFDMDTITIITYLGYSVMICVIFIMWKLFQKKTIAELGFTKRFGSYLAGIVIGAVLVMVSVILTVLTGAIKFNGVFGNIDVKMVSVMALCFVFQGAMEEVLCRGVVQQLLIRKTKVPVALGITAALFTIPHMGNMAGASPVIAVVAIVNLVLISLILSLLTMRFKSIWAACGLHSFWNYILYNILGLNLSGKDESVAAVFDMSNVGSNVLNGADYGIEASIITTGVLAVTLGVMIVLFRKKLMTAD